jgi:Mg-chelatase subunit ChlD
VGASRYTLWPERCVAVTGDCTAAEYFKMFGAPSSFVHEYMQSVHSSSFNLSPPRPAADDNFRGFAEVAYQFLRAGGHISVESRLLLSALGAALTHLKPNNPEFRLGKCLSAFPELFQILELKIPGKATIYAHPLGQLVPQTKKAPSRSALQLTLGCAKSPAVVSQLTGRGFALANPSQTQEKVTGHQSSRKTNVVVVLDLSSSMRGPLLEQAKAAILRLWQLLDRGDSLTIITFNTKVKIAMPRRYKFEPKPGQIKRDTQFVLADLESTVNGFRASGGTALYHALLQALDQTQAAAEADLKAHPTNPDAHTFQLFCITDGGDNRSAEISVEFTADAVNERLRNPGGWASTVNFSTCFVAIGSDAVKSLQPCTNQLAHTLTADNIDAGFRRIQDTIIRVRTVETHDLRQSSLSYGRGG